MDKDLECWCVDRIATARNELQILLGGHRHIIGNVDVTDRKRAQAEEDIICLTAIMADAKGERPTLATGGWRSTRQ